MVKVTRGTHIATLPAIAGPMGSGKSEHMYVSFDLAIYIQAAILSLASALISSIQPAYSAGKLTPIEIIRSGAE